MDGDLNMKVIGADLLEDVVGSYDQTKTTVQGRAQTKTIDGDTAIGPPLNRFIDVFTDSAVTPAANATLLTENGRLFVIQAEATGLAVIALYTVNMTTGVHTYIGKIQAALPDTAATTHTYRSLRVEDTGTSGWKLFLTSTGSVLINGGTFLINNIALSDFVPVGFPTISFATGNNQKAVYFLQDPANIGAGQLQTASAASVYVSSTNRLYVHNGVSATHQYYVYDTSIAPTYSTNTVTITIASPGVVSDAGHAYVAGDQIVFSTTGALPTGIVAGTVYFVRNPVAGVSYEISATTGGAAINTTGTQSGTHSVGRAFGTTGSNFVHKTGNLPALTGTLLLTDSESYALPQHTTNSGFDCIFLATSSALYLGQLSELTSGAVTWPSLVTANVLGTTNEIVTPTLTYASWSNAIDRCVFVANTSLFMVKQMVNNSIDRIFGGLNNRYLETLVNNDVVELQTVTLTSLNITSGWLHFSASATGQRGVYLHDIRSEAVHDYSYVVTKVLSYQADALKFITTIDKLYDYTGSLDVYYRTSGFGSISGGWVSLPFAQDLSAFSVGTSGQIQFKIAFATEGLDTSIPAQICEFYLAYESANEISDYWEYSQDDSSSGNPTDIVFRLKSAYSTSIPTLRFLARDLTNSVVTDHDSVTNISNFSYSTNNGTSYVPFGTPPNTVGTLVRYRYTTPPGVDIRPSLREV